MPATLNTTEHAEQAALFAWAALMESRIPELALLYAVPNGGARHPAVAAKLKAEGVKRGVLDTCLPVARRGYHGAYCEMKVGRNRLTPEQEVWAHRLGCEGYYVTVCYSWEDAARTLTWYLGYDLKEHGL